MHYKHLENIRLIGDFTISYVIYADNTDGYVVANKDTGVKHFTVLAEAIDWILEQMK